MGVPPAPKPLVCDACYPGTSGPCRNPANTVCYSYFPGTAVCPAGTLECSSYSTTPAPPTSTGGQCGGCWPGTSGPCQQANGVCWAYFAGTTMCPAGTSPCHASTNVPALPAPVVCPVDNTPTHVSSWGYGYIIQIVSSLCSGGVIEVPLAPCANAGRNGGTCLPIVLRLVLSNNKRSGGKGRLLGDGSSSGGGVAGSAADADAHVAVVFPEEFSLTLPSDAVITLVSESLAGQDTDTTGCESQTFTQVPLALTADGCAADSYVFVVTSKAAASGRVPGVGTSDGSVAGQAVDDKAQAPASPAGSKGSPVLLIVVVACTVVAVVGAAVGVVVFKRRRSSVPVGVVRSAPSGNTVLVAAWQGAVVGGDDKGVDLDEADCAAPASASDVSDGAASAPEEALPASAAAVHQHQHQHHAGSIAEQAKEDRAAVAGEGEGEKEGAEEEEEFDEESGPVDRPFIPVVVLSSDKEDSVRAPDSAPTTPMGAAASASAMAAARRSSPVSAAPAAARTATSTVPTSAKDHAGMRASRALAGQRSAAAAAAATTSAPAPLGLPGQLNAVQAPVRRARTSSGDVDESVEGSTEWLEEGGSGRGVQAPRGRPAALAPTAFPRAPVRQSRTVHSVVAGAVGAWGGGDSEQLGESGPVGRNHSVAVTNGWTEAVAEEVAPAAAAAAGTAAVVATPASDVEVDEDAAVAVPALLVPVSGEEEESVQQEHLFKALFSGLDE